MKALLTSLLFSLTILTSYAQIDSETPKTTVSDSLSQVMNALMEAGLEHFTFKDIPIDGSTNEFADQLEKQGFTVLEISELDALLSGMFTGEEVHILLQTTPKTKKVFGVTVIYEEQTSWKTLMSDYEGFKSMLTTKYGEPEEVIEEFHDTLYEDSGHELWALSQEKCTFMSAFATKENNGMIKLRISTGGSIVIHYVDAFNYLLQMFEAYDDL